MPARTAPKSVQYLLHIAGSWMRWNQPGKPSQSISLMVIWMDLPLSFSLNNAHLMPRY